MIETIPSALAGERLDRVVSMLTGLSRAQASEVVSEGRVSVDGMPVVARAHRVVEGDHLRIDLAADDGPGSIEPDPSVGFDVVHVDEHLIVVDKPPGLVVHPGAGNPTGTLVQGVVARFPDVAQVGDPARPGIVHRLDKDTSGLLVVARTPLAYDRLVAALAARELDRLYTALAWGSFESPSGMIDAPIGRSTRERTRMAVSARGREARTRYEVRRAYRDPVVVSELDCRLETGRTHQIRVHLSAIGHPLVGDSRYGGERPSLEVPRIVLHAGHLGLTHPVSGERLELDAPIPPDLQAVLHRLT